MLMPLKRCESGRESGQCEDDSGNHMDTPVDFMATRPVQGGDRRGVQSGKSGRFAARFEFSKVE